MADGRKPGLRIWDLRFEKALWQVGRGRERGDPWTATGKRSYAAQLCKKWEWVAANRATLAKALGAGTGEVRVVAALVTLYPTYAAFKIADVPCVSAVELMEDYLAAGRWPYSVGIR